MLGFCRAHYAAVHMWRGRWAEAEEQLEEAVRAYGASRPFFVSDPLARLAELYRLKGDVEGAERLLDDLGPRSAPLGRARIALDRGDTRRAAELAERVLRQIPRHGRLKRVPALEIIVRARAALGEHASAAEAASELREVAGRVGTEPLHAAADMAEGVLAAAAGDHDRAKGLLEDAGDRFERSDAPYEAAQARLALAATLLALGREDHARREAAACLRRLTELGAAAEARRAERLLDTMAPGGADGRPLPEVTPREREVLRWVAEGLTNRQVAERLSVSEHTIHRHVTNILRKLDLPSRAAAAAHAVRSGLLPPPTK
jgi:ATP/maltotriose-dependent transcriptional regulator MalT